MREARQYLQRDKLGDARRSSWTQRGSRLNKRSSHSILRKAPTGLRASATKRWRMATRRTKDAITRARIQTAGGIDVKAKTRSRRSGAHDRQALSQQNLTQKQTARGLRLLVGSQENLRSIATETTKPVLMMVTPTQIRITPRRAPVATQTTLLIWHPVAGMSLEIYRPPTASLKISHLSF